MYKSYMFITFIVLNIKYSNKILLNIYEINILKLIIS